MTNLLRYIVDFGVLGLLAIFSFLAVAVTIERFLHYMDVRVESFVTRAELEIDLTKNLTILYTIAANSVYIGLLGTVLGIMLTFATMGESGGIDAKTIMSALSYTLIATACGLVVAIPSIFCYNFLTRRMEVLLARWDALAARR
ncbi:MAG: hypothetical protein RL154_413 [Pseudomonadota bacterium]|jgi:biopolymer transport protein ExbB